MSLKNTPENYGSVSRGFHWLTAALVIGLLVLGLLLEEMARGAFKLKMINLHKSVGVLVLLLTLARILWHFYSKKPALIATLKKWEKVLSHTLHGLLYLALIGMPMSGWIMSSAKGYPVSLFKLATLPQIVEENKALAEWAGEIHEILGYTLIVIIIVHFVGALKHHFIDRDDTLRRMTPFLKRK